MRWLALFLVIYTSANAIPLEDLLKEARKVVKVEEIKAGKIKKVKKIKNVPHRQIKTFSGYIMDLGKEKKEGKQIKNHPKKPTEIYIGKINSCHLYKVGKKYKCKEERE